MNRLLPARHVDTLIGIAAYLLQGAAYALGAFLLLCLIVGMVDVAAFISEAI